MKIQQINELVSKGVKQGVGQLSTQDAAYNGRTIKIKNQDLINFGSCSYLGLELEPRIKLASISAMNNYGVQYSSSRAFVSNGLYDEFENLLEQIFGQPTILAPTTTLGHLSALPVLVGKNDAVIYDFQVHNSVLTAIHILRARGTFVVPLRHNRIDLLEERIVSMQDKFDRIWYMADGVYSMYGDGLPTMKIQQLLEEYESFHLYVDDAHGMSWCGQNGSGFVLDHIAFHPKMYMATSLAKGFGCNGGVLIFPDRTAKELVRNCGSTLIFSGPVPPAILGAGIEAAKIHLSPQITVLQKKLQSRIHFFNATAEKLQLPLIAKTNTPIFFIKVGMPEMGYAICKKMMAAGYYMNLAIYPSVAKNNTGLRATVTVNQSEEDIGNMLMILKMELEKLSLAKPVLQRDFKTITEKLI